MNISASTASLPLINSQPVVKQATGQITSSSVTPPLPTTPQVNISTRQEVSPVSENSTYSRPVNNPQADNTTAANIKIQNGAADQEKQDPEEVAATDTSETEKSNKEQSEQYSEQELKQISSLKLRDKEVIAHERAHSSVGGQYSGSPNYSYKTGPDGVKYAVSGEVSIDTSRVPGDPQATLQKAQQIKAAALAPAEPSGQDRRVAAKAEQMAAQARADIMQQHSGVETAAKPSDRSYESVVPDHFTGAVTDETLEQKTTDRRVQINNFYQNVSITKSSSTFQTEI